MKSLHTKLNEALEQMTSKQRDKFYESRKSGAPIEVQVNCAEAILAGKVKESLTPITKHNGVADNGGDWFTESARRGAITEKADPYAAADEIMFKSMNLSESDVRKLKNLPPVGVNLTPTQLREFRLMRSYRISEADAVRLALKVE
jgi:hypothetical protein